MSKRTNIKHKLEDIKIMLSEISNTIVIIDTVYINNKTKLKCKCLIDGHEWGACWGNLKKGKGCPICGQIRTVASRKLNIQQANERLISIDSTLRILEDEFINSKIKMKYVCIKHGIYGTMNWSGMSVGQGCSKCNIEKRSGENHHNWNPDLTDEDRIKRRDLQENIDWRNLVYKKDDYMYVKCNRRCGNGDTVYLEAHHLDGYHWCEEKRFDVDNGVTLCEDCHISFHSLYGWKHNTKEQFEEFMQDW